MAWRTHMLAIISELVHSKNFEEGQLLDQWQFARNEVIKAIVGIERQTRIAISVLNYDSLTVFVKGIDTDEMAQLVFKMAKYDFDLVVYYKRHLAGGRNIGKQYIQVVTRFSDDTRRSYGYRGPGAEYLDFFGEE